MLLEGGGEASRPRYDIKFVGEGEASRPRYDINEGGGGL